MIRSIVPEDRPSLLALIIASELFQPDEHDSVAQLLDDFYARDDDDPSAWIVEEADGVLVSSAFYAPERFTDGTWNLLMIVVHPERRRQGFAERLIQHIQQRLAANGARLLLVETSGLLKFGGARALYLACGFDQEARIRDYYRQAEDKFIYRLDLAAAPAL